MKEFFKTNEPAGELMPVVAAVPIVSDHGEGAPKSLVAQGRQPLSSSDAAAISFLRQFRVLLGAARLYQRNHPRLMEILASAEHQLRVILAPQSTLVFAVERDGITLPRHGLAADELLNDPRGELRALAEELLRSGICSILFAAQINVGELDEFAHQISQVPRSATPGDTASRKAWDGWLQEQRIAGIRLNLPTERRDSLLVASLVSAVLAYDDAPQRSSQLRPALSLPEVSFEKMAATLGVLGKLAPPRDPGTLTTAEDVARRIHSVLSPSDRSSVSLIVQGVSCVKPREGETLEPYLERLTDALMLAYLRQEFDAGRVTPPELAHSVAQLDQQRLEAATGGGARPRLIPLDETRVAALCEKFWNALPAREIAKILRSGNAWCIPAGVVGHFLEPLAAAAENKHADAAGREARAIVSAYGRCLESEERKARRTVAAGLAELAPQIERLWPHPGAAEFGTGVVQALLRETSPGIAGLLSAVVGNLARVALAKHEYAEFERMLEMLESAPRDEEHAHISTLVGRVLNDEQWLYLVDEALSNRPLNPVVSRLLRRCPDRLIDRLGLLLTATRGTDALPAMVRLVHATGEPVLGTLESRLYEPRRHRIVTAIYLLASSDPKRLANALPRALASWDWSLQDLAVSELSRWTNPSVVAACAQAFLAVVAEAHALVVPCVIDYLGLAHEAAATPLLLKLAAGEYLGLRDIYLRIKAVEALGRMRVAEAAPLLRRILRERNGLAHTEPAALRAVSEEALGLLENRPSSARVRTAETTLAKSSATHGRPRRYLRVQLPTPFAAVVSGTHGGAAKVRTISLGGAFLETDHRLAAGESVNVEIRAGLRRIQATSVVRNVMTRGVGVEFVRMKAQDRERLRRLVAHLLK
jgi:PilZ domain